MKRGINKSASATATGMDAIDAMLRAAGVGIKKSAAESGFGEDPNNMTPPKMSEFDTQRSELKAAVPNSLASDGAAYNDGTPLDGSFQGAEGVNEVTDTPEVTPKETPEDTDAGTESPAQVDVNNVEGNKSAGFNAQLNQLIKEQGLAKAAHTAGAYGLECLEQLLGPAAGSAPKSTKSASVNAEQAGMFAAAEDFLNVIRSNPQGYLQEKVAAVVADATADADMLYMYLVEKSAEEEAMMADQEAAAAEEEAAALEQEAAAEEAGGEQLPPEALAAIQEIAAGGDAGGAGGVEGGDISEEELIEALSEALDANGAAPEELPEMEAANLPPDMPPAEKAAAVQTMAKYAAAVNVYRNGVRSGRIQTKRASVRKIQLVHQLTNDIMNMRRY